MPIIPPIGEMPAPFVRPVPIAFFKCTAAYEGGLKPEGNTGAATCDFVYRDGVCHITVYAASADDMAALTASCETWNGLL